MRDMTHLEEPQSAAGIPALVPGGWADQPRLAGMGALLKEIRCQFIILARKDEPTADYARHRITRKDELTLDYALRVFAPGARWHNTE